MEVYNFLLVSPGTAHLFVTVLQLLWLLWILMMEALQFYLQFYFLLDTQLPQLFFWSLSLKLTWVHGLASFCGVKRFLPILTAGIFTQIFLRRINFHRHKIRLWIQFNISFYTYTSVNIQSHIYSIFLF